ncbi:hypothetical protein [Streptomyces sp. NPDC001056]
MAAYVLLGVTVHDDISKPQAAAAALDTLDQPAPSPEEAAA